MKLWHNTEMMKQSTRTRIFATMEQEIKLQSTCNFVATEKQRANRAHFDATMRQSKQRAQLDLNLAY